MLNTSIRPIQHSLFVSWVHRKSQAFLLGVSMVLLLGIIVATFLTTHQLIKHNRWVDHSYEVNNNLENIYSNTNAIVASLRGYLLTGNPSFESSLKRYESKLMQHYERFL